MGFSGFHECVGCTPHLPHVHAYSETRINVLAEEKKTNDSQKTNKSNENGD